MNIHEYQAKQLMHEMQIPVGTGVVLTDASQVDSKIEQMDADLYVVKAQIHAGGRGKAGGVKVTKSKQEAKQYAKDMFGKVLHTPQTGPEGKKVSTVYVESGCDIKKEYYFSMLLDRAKSRVVIMASREGGVDIEEVSEKNPEAIVKIHVDPISGIQSFHLRTLSKALGMDKDLSKQLHPLIIKMYEFFQKHDALLVEINPLIVTSEDKILVLDAKVEFDDNALARQPGIAALRDEAEEDPLEFKANQFDLSYVRMDGNIGCMVNGAGLAMATMDIIKLYGGNPANFLDVGGGADKDRVKEAFKIILSDSRVKGILVNIFGGIMRCNIIAEGIIEAAKDINLAVPLVVRLAGTNYKEGKTMLDDSDLNITSADSLADAAKKIVEITGSN